MRTNDVQSTSLPATAPSSSGPSPAAGRGPSSKGLSPTVAGQSVASGLAYLTGADAAGAGPRAAAAGAHAPPTPAGPDHDAAFAAHLEAPTAHVGWAGAHGMNRGERTVRARNADEHAAGVRRIPLEGLSTVAREHGQGRAIVLVPPAVMLLPPGSTVDALVHLHGNGAQRYDDSHGAPMDVSTYRMEEQLLAAPHMIGILPQSNNPGADGNFGPNRQFRPAELVAEVLALLAGLTPPALPADAHRGALVLSAHSGGGTEMQRQMRRELEAGGDPAADLPGDAVNHVLLFDCINSSRPGQHGEATDGFVGPQGIFWRWTQRRLERDRAHLVGRTEAQQRAYLATSTRLVGTSSNDSDPADPGAYPRRCRILQRHIDDWFAAHAAELPRSADGHGGTVGDLWHANYVATLRAGGEHVDVLARRDNLATALSHLPGSSPAATAPVPAPVPTPAPTPDVATAPTDAPAATTPAAAPPRAAAARGGPFTAAQITESIHDPEVAAFMRAVYQGQLGAHPDLRRFHPSVDADHLGQVEGVSVHVDIVADLNALLSAAREALTAAKNDPSAPDHALAMRTESIGVHNGYRGMSTERSAWISTFQTRLNNHEAAAHRRSLPDGPYGPTAIRETIAFMRGAKAIPGFSNHSQGLAVDFKTRFSGHNLGPSTAQRPIWRTTWLRHWLVAHGRDHGFTGISTEEWHFDHRHGSHAGASCT